MDRPVLIELDSWDELRDRWKDLPPPSADDVWVTAEGDRLETAEQWLEHMDALMREREAESI